MFSRHVKRLNENVYYTIDAFYFDVFLEKENCLEIGAIFSWLDVTLEGRISELFYYTYNIEVTIKGKLVKGYFEVRHSDDLSGEQIMEYLLHTPKDFDIITLDYIPL